MNNACTISARAARNINPNMYIKYIDFKFNIYYRVKFKMYVHFNPITIVYPIEKKYLGSIFAPYETTFLKPITIDAKTISKQHTFTINSKNAKPTIDKYVKNNIKIFTGSTIWNLYIQEIIDRYINEINEKYNIDLDKSAADYSIQFVWEIESEDNIDDYMCSSKYNIR